MTSKDAFEQITHGGSTDFHRAIAICESVGGYCRVGGLAVNCYVEPVYTLAAALVGSTGRLETIRQQLAKEGFVLKEFPSSVNAQMKGSDLRIQFTRDRRDLS